MKVRLLKKIRQTNFEFWNGGFQKKPVIIDSFGVAHVMPFFMVNEKYCNIRLLLKSNVLPNKLNLLISEKLKSKLNELSKKL